MAANFVRCPRDRGESVEGGLPPPFRKKETTNRNSPPRAARASEFRCPSEERLTDSATEGRPA